MAEKAGSASTAGTLPVHRREPAAIMPIGLVHLSLLAIVVGIVTGLGAVLFRDLIGLIHNLLFLGRFAISYDANTFTPPSPWGIGVILVPVVGAVIVTFLVVELRAGSARPRRSRSHGRDLLRQRHHPSRRCRREVARLRRRHRHRRGRGPRGAHHPDRLGARLDPWPDRAHAARPAHHPGRRRGGSRHRRNLQHAHRRGAVHDRADDARGERVELPARGPLDRRRDLRRPLFLRRGAGLRRAAPHAPVDRHELRPDPRLLCPAGRRRGPGGHRLRALAALGRGPVREDRQPLPAPHSRHAVGRRAHLSAAAGIRALLCRRRGLRHDPGHPARTIWRRPGCSPCCSAASFSPPRSASDRAPPAVCSRRRCSSAPRSARPSPPA